MGGIEGLRLHPRPEAERSASGRLVVYYDGWCALCTRAAGLWRRLDLLGRLDLRSVRDPAAARELGPDLPKAQRRMICRDPVTGERHEGFDAVVHVASRLPALWPLLPLLLGARLTGLGGPLYDFVASRRTVIPVGACDGGSSCYSESAGSFGGKPAGASARGTSHASTGASERTNALAGVNRNSVFRTPAASGDDH